MFLFSYYVLSCCCIIMALTRSEEGGNMKEWQQTILAFLLFFIVVTGIGFFINHDSIGEVKRKYMSSVMKDLSLDDLPFASSTLSDYIKDKNLMIKDVENVESDGSDAVYDLVLEGELTGDFEKLTEEERYDVLTAYSEALDSSSYSYSDDDYITCGNSSVCSAETLILKSGSDTYEIYPKNYSSIEKNGEEYMIKQVSKPISSDNDYVSEQAVYDYMKAQYEQLTNYGENYDPEIHDSQVANMAASRFGISASEAGQIYIKMDLKSIGY